MNLDLTDEQLAIQETVREFVDRRIMPVAQENDINHHLDMDAIAGMAELGLLGIVIPEEYGGAGLDFVSEALVCEEIERGEAAFRTLISVHVGLNSLTLLRYADEEQKQRYLAPQARGDKLACFGLTEPAAGSDVAGIRTRAEREGDGWVINGQKVWTSGAHYSDYGIIITRTDPNVPKHQGLTMFFLSMKTPGVEVRPIKQMSGGANFNEVFFTDVRIPDSQRLGKVGEGWKAALTTLMNERLAVGMPSGGLDVDELMELARDTDLEDGPAIRNQQVRGKIADWYVQQQGLKLTRYRTLTALSKGQTPGPESSIIKIVAAPKMQDMGAFAMELMGPAGIMKEDVPQAAGFQAQWIGGAGFRIAGGTDEILRNIVAERVLGLPADVRVDKDIPFNKLTRS